VLARLRAAEVPVVALQAETLGPAAVRSVQEWLLAFAVWNSVLAPQDLQDFVRLR
jgi:hypothetical protein